MARYFPCGNTRREFVWEMGAGFAGLALLVLQAVAVGREKLVDHHLPKVVLGVDVVMPSLCREPVRLRRKIGHAVVRHPSDRHETIVSRRKLNLPRPARHAGDG